MQSTNSTPYHAQRLQRSLKVQLKGLESLLTSLLCRNFLLLTLVLVYRLSLLSTEYIAVDESTHGAPFAAPARAERLLRPRPLLHVVRAAPLRLLQRA